MKDTSNNRDTFKFDEYHLAPFKTDINLLIKDICKRPLKYVVIIIALIIIFKLLF